MKEFVQFLLGAIIGLSTVCYFIFFPIEWTVQTIFIVTMSVVISFPLTIILHEAGHAIVGLLRGMRLLNVSVGPFVMERHEGKFYFHFARSSLGYAGRAMLYFPDQIDKETMRDKLITYIYGGPITNLVLSFISLWIAFSVWHHPFYLVFGAINLLVGVTNLRPMKVKSVLTDGMVIQNLRKTPVNESVFIASYMLLRESMNNGNGEKWDSELMQHVERLVRGYEHDPLAKSLLHTLLYYYLPDHVEKVEAIGRAVAFTRTNDSADISEDSADIAFATALLFTDQLREYPAIESSLQLISKIDNITHLKRNALLLYIRGEEKNALDSLKDACTLLEKWHPLYLRGDTERKLLDLMIEKIEKN